jgi:hypothetical protein
MDLILMSSLLLILLSRLELLTDLPRSLFANELVNEVE